MKLDELTDEQLIELHKELSKPEAADEMSDEELIALHQELSRKEESSTTATDAALEGVIQGATLSFSDEIGAGVQAAADAGQEFLNKVGLAGKSPSQINAELQAAGFSGDVEVDTYAQALDENRQTIADLKEKHPVAFTAGEIGGGLLLPGGATLKAAEKATKLAKMGIMVGSAAGLGAIEGLGSSEEDEWEAKFSDAMYGAGAGVVGLGLGAGAAKGLKKFGSMIKDEAINLAEKSMGIFNTSSRRAFRTMLERKGLDADEFIERVNKEIDVDGDPLIHGFKSQAEVIDDATARLSQLGDDMGRIIKVAEEEGIEAAINPLSFANTIKSRLMSKFNKDAVSRAASKNQIRETEKILTRFQDLIDDGGKLQLSDIQRFKTQLLADFQADKEFYKITDVEQGTLREIGTYIEDYIKSKSKNEDLIGQFTDTKQRFGTMAEYLKFVGKSVDYDEKGLLGKLVKNLSWIGAAAGASAGPGGIIPGILIAGALKTASKNPTLQRQVSGAAMAVGKRLEKGADPEWVARLSNAASRSYDHFEEELMILEKKTQGFITDPGEAEMWDAEIDRSNLPPRDAMRNKMQVHQEGRVPDLQRSQKPMMKQFEPRDRDENGRKI